VNRLPRQCLVGSAASATAGAKKKQRQYSKTANNGGGGSIACAAADLGLAGASLTVAFPHNSNDLPRPANSLAKQALKLKSQRKRRWRRRRWALWLGPARQTFAGQQQEKKHRPIGQRLAGAGQAEERSIGFAV
jgi:hypothetical protein